MHPESAIDMALVPDVRNFLEGLRNDLAVMDIARGRDFGLPSFAQARAEFGLPVPQSFADITPDAAVAAALQQLYGSVGKVDLWVGGLAESATSGGMVGRTFAAIISRQFARTRDGDRYFYLNPDLAWPAADLAAVSGVTLAAVVARTTDWKDPPASMFAVASAASLVRPAPTPCAAAPPSAAPSPSPGGAARRVVQLSPALSLSFAPPAAGAAAITLTVTLQSTTGWAGLGLGAASRRGRLAAHL